MLCKTSRFVIEKAAEMTGVRLYDFRVAVGQPEVDSTRVRSYRFRLKTTLEKVVGPRGGVTYRATRYPRRAVARPWSGGEPRRLPGIVCWHGYRDYMRAVFSLDPDAIFRTGIETYRGSDDFERKFVDTYYKNIGSVMYPCYMGQACDCNEGPGEPRVASSLITAQVRTMKQSDILKCPFVIMMPEHYREDGTCRCNDPKATVMQEWGYHWNEKTEAWS